MNFSIHKSKQSFDLWIENNSYDNNECAKNYVTVSTIIMSVLICKYVCQYIYTTFVNSQIKFSTVNIIFAAHLVLYTAKVWKNSVHNNYECTKNYIWSPLWILIESCYNKNNYLLALIEV